MIELITSILGALTKHFFSAAIDIIICWFYMLVLCHGKKQRSFFGIRFLISLFISIGLCVLLSSMRTNMDILPVHMLFEFSLGVLELLAIFLLYDESLSETLFMFSGVIVTKNFSGTAIPLIRNLLGNNDMETISFLHDYVPLRDWTIYFIVQLVFLIVITYIFRRAEKRRNVSLELIGSVFLCAVTLTLKCVMAPIARYYQSVSFEPSVYIKVLILMLYLVVIAIRAGLLSRRKIETELQITEGLLRQEKKRYTEMRDSIEVINMRCHDLKRQLSGLQSKLTTAEIEALREAIEIYDSNINTGSEILDTVLYQKELYCRKNNIRLSWLCNSSALSFMVPASLYALLDNALENAIEAVMKLPEKKRVINLTIKKETSIALIEVSNYFNRSISIVSGTAKEDKRHHGFGLKSMCYIASEYGGSVETNIVDDMFFLTIIIPIK